MFINHHKTVTSVVVAILVTMLITTGVIVGIMMVVTKENTCNKETSSPPTSSKAPITGNITHGTTKPKISSRTASLIVIGGYQEADGVLDSLNSVDVYSLSSGDITWSHKGKRSPYSWHETGRAVKNGIIYVIGTFRFRNSPPLQDAAAKYSAVENTWQIILP